MPPGRSRGRLRGASARSRPESGWRSVTSNRGLVRPYQTAAIVAGRSEEPRVACPTARDRRAEILRITRSTERVNAPRRAANGDTMTNVGLFRFQNRDPRGSASFGRPIIAGRLNQGAWEPEHSGFVGGRKMSPLHDPCRGSSPRSVSARWLSARRLACLPSWKATASSLSIFTERCGTSRNLFFSPSSISTALAMT